MTQDTPSIHDFDFSLICEYFAALERQGPVNSAAAGLVTEQWHEAELYDRYKAYYGYAFFIAKKL